MSSCDQLEPVMPILSTSPSGCDVVSSSCSAFNDDDGSRDLLVGSRDATQQEGQDDSSSLPKKRGPKKKRMTPARIAKLKQRRIKVNTSPHQPRFTLNIIYYNI